MLKEISIKYFYFRANTSLPQPSFNLEHVIADWDGTLHLGYISPTRNAFNLTINK